MSGTAERSADTASRDIRIAALGDIHFDGRSVGSLREAFADIDRNADVLVLCGDLTTHGKAEQAEALIGELAGVEIPIVCVLGNHDFEGGAEDRIAEILEGRGIHVLDGEHVVIEGVGFAGAKGFAGGFGRGALAPFGEPIIKAFAQAAIDEAIKIENAMRNLATETRVVVLHFAPIVDTVQGEPEYILPFLGSSRLAQPIDALGADVVFHGHAHHGSLEGRTATGIPVYNVAQPLLRESGRHYFVWTARVPDRRGRNGRDAGAPGAGGSRPEVSRSARGTT
jgi:Icc-related predicted phosphoesterase